MKIASARLALVALATVALSLVGSSQASAGSVSIQIGSPPPPPPVYVGQPWARPYRSAIWIQPHYEWIRGRWVWVNGYYTYPPRRGAYWVPGRYRHGYYYPGHWGY